MDALRAMLNLHWLHHDAGKLRYLIDVDQVSHLKVA
jgi:hypothetical protein